MGSMVIVISDELKRRDTPRPGVSSNQILSTALLFVMLIAGMAATGLVLLVNRDQPAGPFEISECASIVANVERLACFDELVRRSGVQPFKGATAPAMNRTP